MKNTIVLIVLFFFMKEANAQVSGYMGKKFSISYAGGIGVPHLSILNEEFKALLPINHALRLEYVYNNNSAVVFRYKLGMNAGMNDISNFRYVNFEEKYKFYSHTYSIMAKFYRKNALAPIGSYSTVGFGFQNLVLKDMIRPNYITNDITLQNYSQYDVILHYGIGRNWIVFDRMLLGFHFETSMPFASLAGIFTIDDYKNGYKSTSISNKFNFSNEILRLSMNIGFLAF